VTKERVGLISQPLAKLPDNPRLADTRLTGQKHDLAFTIFRLLKPFEEQT
jgi:hypothetical protein